MDSYFVILAIGFLAQAFFSARILVQWLLSERAKQIVSPSVFWILSLAGAYLLCLYGWLRDDFSIVLGQFISYYIYLWNLRLKGIWTRIPRIFRWVLVLTPIVAIGFVMRDASNFVAHFLRNEDIPLWLVIFGSLGQVLFTLRFVYQLAYSYRKHQSLLPVGFWVISLVGASLIVIYGIIRLDLVLIVGQSFGLVAYFRNIWLGKYAKSAVKNEK